MAQFDPDAFIEENTKKETVPGPGPVSEPGPGPSFDPDKFITESVVQPTAVPTQQQGLTPPDGFLPAYYYGAPSGVGQLARNVGSAAEAARAPFMDAAGKAAARYVGPAGVKPFIDMAAMTTMGTLTGGAAIPPIATFESARAAYGATKGLFSGAKEMADYLSKFPAEAADRLGPAVTTFADNLNEAEYAKFKTQIDKVGVERAIRDFKIPDRLKDVEAFTGAVKQMKEITPPSIARQVAGPLLRGAARVAGPVGLAYDVVQAYPYYEAANAPERMASGEVGRQVSQARRAMLSQPTPAPLSPQEAANLLASGDRRLIDIYGGVNKLVEAAGQTVAQPETPGFIDRAMNTWRRYQGVPTR
jgi:hypothetical protein